MKMDLSEAHRVIRDDKASPIAWLTATTVIASPENDFLEVVNDLLICLRRGAPSASTAATVLYAHTGRPRPEDVTQYVHDADDWRRYLVAGGFLK